MDRHGWTLRSRRLKVNLHARVLTHTHTHIHVLPTKPGSRRVLKPPSQSPGTVVAEGCSTLGLSWEPGAIQLPWRRDGDPERGPGGAGWGMVKAEHQLGGWQEASFIRQHWLLRGVGWGIGGQGH